MSDNVPTYDTTGIKFAITRCYNNGVSNGHVVSLVSPSPVILQTAIFNNGWFFPSSGEWEVNSGHWEVGRISGKLRFCSLVQWQPHCSGLQKCGEEWGVKSGNSRVGSEGG